MPVSITYLPYRIRNGNNSMNDTKPRAVLSLKKTPPVTEPEPAPAPLPPTPQTSTATKPKSPKQPQPPKELSPAFKCLQAHWPDLFDLKQPTPLQIGILEPIIEHLKQAGEPFSAKQIRHAIGEHCRRFNYLKALTNAPHRVGLHGELSLISEKDRERAMEWLKARCKAKNKHAEQPKTETAAQ